MSRSCIRRSRKSINTFKRLSGWSLIEEISRPREESNIDRTTICQPAIFALQVALVRLWKSWGIEPSVVVGHSVGEVAAAWCAGIYSLPDAIRLVYHRSRLQDTTGGHGRMFAAGITADEAHAAIGELAEQVQVTAINSPHWSRWAATRSRWKRFMKSLSAKVSSFDG